jgi:hypothetical protein
MTSLWIIAFVTGIVVFALFAYIYIKILYRWVFDGADFRAPHLLNLIVYGIILLAMMLSFFMSSYVSGMYVFFLKVYFIIVGKTLISSRLQSYITMNIRKETKYKVFTFYNLVFWVIIIILFIDFDPSVLQLRQVPPLSGEIFDYLVYIFSTNVFDYSILIAILSVTNLGIILWFDISEKRKKHVKRDLVFIIPLLVIILNLIDEHLSVNKYIMLFFDYLYIVSPMVLVRKEARSIIKHSDGIDSRVREIKEILRVMSKTYSGSSNNGTKFDLSSKQKYQLNYIANMLGNDRSLRGIILRKSFFYSKGYNLLIDEVEKRCVIEYH